MVEVIKRVLDTIVGIFRTLQVSYIEGITRLVGYNRYIVLLAIILTLLLLMVVEKKAGRQFFRSIMSVNNKTVKAFWRSVQVIFRTVMFLLITVVVITLLKQVIMLV